MNEVKAGHVYDKQWVGKWFRPRGKGSKGPSMNDIRKILNFSCHNRTYQYILLSALESINPPPSLLSADVIYGWSPTSKLSFVAGVARCINHAPSFVIFALILLFLPWPPSSRRTLFFAQNANPVPFCATGTNVAEICIVK